MRINQHQVQWVEWPVQMSKLRVRIRLRGRLRGRIRARAEVGMVPSWDDAIVSQPKAVL